MSEHAQEIARRRTFAIISHPDAGKTTLTEKLLLYGGAVQLAGSVTARKNERATSSDWMELERKRGISISSTVLQFDYRDYCINLLDTPGHKDFSEDTYRVLTAVDAVVMVIDAGKGIESQTRKLFEVCRHRGIPIFTFMNKLDRPTREPLELMDEIENGLQLGVYPMNWPLGTGTEFKGVYDRQTSEVHLFERTPHGTYRAPVSVCDLSDQLVCERLSEQTYRQVVEEIEMLNAAGTEFDRSEILTGGITPVFFGSAMNNFGVQLLLDSFLEHSSPPTPRRSVAGMVQPEHPSFSGFIFKIQANMDPRHRDRIAFLRIVSGKFTRDMLVAHQRTGKKVRLSNSHKLFARDRETVNDAYPGDVIGLVGKGEFSIGDTLTEDGSIVYNEIPRFATEHFAFLHNPTPSKYKQFREGLQQLLQEGVVQSFELPSSDQNVPLLAAVGPLQFEVVQYRLESEYGAPSRLEPAPWQVARWMRPASGDPKDANPDLPTGATIAIDSAGQRVLLLPNEWSLRFFRERNPLMELSDIPFPDKPAEVNA
jgi:peptide chain release factor 3